MGPGLTNDADHEREVRVSISALVRDYPGVSPDRIEQLLRSHLARTAGASVQLYRVLLAERATRVELRLDERVRSTSEPTAESLRTSSIVTGEPPGRVNAPAGFTDERTDRAVMTQPEGSEDARQLTTT